MQVMWCGDEEALLNYYNQEGDLRTNVASHASVMHFRSACVQQCAPGPSLDSSRGGVDAL